MTLGADRGVQRHTQIMEFIVEVIQLVRDPGEQIVVFCATDYGIYCGGHSACA